MALKAPEQLLKGPFVWDYFVLLMGFFHSFSIHYRMLVLWQNNPYCCFQLCPKVFICRWTLLCVTEIHLLTCKFMHFENILYVLSQGFHYKNSGPGLFVCCPYDAVFISKWKKSLNSYGQNHNSCRQIHLCDNWGNFIRRLTPCDTTESSGKSWHSVISVCFGVKAVYLPNNV